jgi:hypothetical protein
MTKNHSEGRTQPLLKGIHHITSVTLLLSFARLLLFFYLLTRYKLKECVGKGSEGSVWRAVCIPMKKDVAIKIIDLESMPTAALEELRVSN